MQDVRSLYISQLVNHYKLKSYFDSVEMYQVNYRCENDKEPRFLYFRHNEGLDAIMSYINTLEKKIDELQYVERIIKLAKESNYD